MRSIRHSVRALRVVLGGTASLLAVGAASSCSNLADDCKNTLTCNVPGGDAGDAGACTDPSTEPCAISDQRGVFVSAANGSDNG
ncbi:MAG TPA: hypothetical protein VK524_23375, partial [Polyangiaceae bacterium]|nr:hypothetical protein [Polyangiaceae bacterium]